MNTIKIHDNLKLKTSELFAKVKEQLLQIVIKLLVDSGYSVYKN